MSVRLSSRKAQSLERSPSLASLAIIVTGLIFTPDLHAENTVSSKNSACSVRDKAGEFANVDIIKNGKAVFHLNGKSVRSAFSPSGKYITFTGTDMDARAFEGSRYLLLIYNCDRQVAKGYARISGKLGNPASEGSEPYLADVSWGKDEKSITAKNCHEKPAINGQHQLDCKPLKLIFAEKNKLP
jgi:hypothetical protein